MLTEADYNLPMLLGLAVVLIAYTLAILNTSIIRFFEGYPIITTPCGKWFTSSNHRYVNSIMERRKQAKLSAQRFRKSHPILADRLELKSRAYSTELFAMYPSVQQWRILPTRLGNVIAAAEEYTSVLFNLDAVFFWPYLVPLLNKSGYASFIASEKSLLDFLLNMSVISIVTGIEMVYLDILLSSFSWSMAAIKMGLALIAAFLFYLFAIQGALGWGYTIRVAFTLHKDQLRQKLGFKYVDSHEDEIAQWDLAARFFRERSKVTGDLLFDYSSIARNVSLEEGTEK